MQYKLYYTNEYGQVVYPSGKLFERNENCSDFYEVFENLNDAKKKGKAFLEKKPLMTCTIYFGDNNEIALFPDKESFQKATRKTEP